MSDGMPGAQAEQALQYHVKYEEVFDEESGGMYMAAPSYSTSFYFEGAKYLDPKTGRLGIATSTAQSNRRTSFEYGMPYASMEHWTSFKPGHTKEMGKGMSTEPGSMDECLPEGSVGEKYEYLQTGFQRINSLEHLLEEAGIHDYTRFICGYHIHGQAATEYDPKLCALDWYAQCTTDRLQDPNVWDHYLIKYQVCPTQCIYAKAYKRMPQYEGWYGHKIGGQY